MEVGLDDRALFNRDVAIKSRRQTIDDATFNLGDKTVRIHRKAGICGAPDMHDLWLWSGDIDLNHLRHDGAEGIDQRDPQPASFRHGAAPIGGLCRRIEHSQIAR